MLVSQELLDIIGNFDVHKFTSFSNHCIISCTLCTCFNSQIIYQCQLEPLPEKFPCFVDALDKYVQNIISPESRSKIDVFLNTAFEESDKAVEEFNSILYENARKCAKLVKRLPLSKKKRVNRKPWFSDSCKDLYNTVKRYEKLVNKFPQNADSISFLLTGSFQKFGTNLF
jgi:hypothetical protein